MKPFGVPTEVLVGCVILEGAGSGYGVRSRRIPRTRKAFMASGTESTVRTISHKAYLSKAGHRNLDDLLAQLTWLWNVALSKRKRAWERDQRSVGYYEQQRQLTVKRRDPAWSRFPAWAQRSTLQRLDRSYRSFFARGGYPRFKGCDRGIRSFEMAQFPRVRTNGKWSWVSVKGVGRVRYRGMPPEGAVKLLRIVRTPRRVKVQFVVEQAVEVTPDSRPMVGVDVGIRSRVALSTGETVPGVRLDRSELKRRQRRLSKAKRGGANRRKRVEELRREYQRVGERERGALHELTAWLVRDVSASFAVEDLRIPNMVRNRRLARSITEQQWGTLVRMLSYKAESAGGTVVRVDPRNTSRECSGCGRRRDMPLAVRVYRCPCGLTLDRDINAARNVLQRGREALNPGGTIPDCAEQTHHPAAEGSPQVQRKAG